MVDAGTSAELNRLYWDSDLSVGEIADRLDLSRRALYDGIDALSAGAPCPDCGEGLVFRNRTALDNGEAECPECGRAAAVDGGAAYEDEGEPEIEQEWRAAPLSPVGGAGSGPLLGIALLGGVALGAVLGYLHRSR